MCCSHDPCNGINFRPAAGLSLALASCVCLVCKFLSLKTDMNRTAHQQLSTPIPLCPCSRITTSLRSGCGSVALHRKCSHMVEKNQKPWVVCAFAVHRSLVSSVSSCKMRLLCCSKNSLSDADVIVGGRRHMLSVKHPHSHATLTRNDVKIALLLLCQSRRG